MFGFSPLMMGSKRSPIEFVGASYSESGTIAPPAHQAGDLLVMVASAQSNAMFSTASGWTLIGQVANDPSGTASDRVMTAFWRISNGVMGNITGPMYRNTILAFRHAKGIGQKVLHTTNSVTGVSNFSVPNILLQEPGESLVVTSYYTGIISGVSTPEPVVIAPGNMAVYGPTRGSYYYTPSLYLSASGVELAMVMEILQA